MLYAIALEFAFLGDLAANGVKSASMGYFGSQGCGPQSD